MQKSTLARLSVVLSTLTLLIIHSAKDIKAAVSCPSNEMPCPELNYQGGCTSPCIMVVTKQGQPSAKGAAMSAQCACQEAQNQPGTVPLGQPCQQNSDCAPPGKYCWGGWGEAPVCHDMTSNEAMEQEHNQVNSISSPLKGNCIDTAIGCIPIEQEGFVTFFLRWALGIAGGIAFILIVISSFQIMTSRGDPKKLQAGKELLSSAIMGLMLLIFSVFILRTIGVEILKIPGF